MRKGWRWQRVVPQQRGGKLELQSEGLLGGVFHIDNIKWCSRKLVSSFKKLNELRGVVRFWKCFCWFCKKSIVIYASKDCLPSLWTTAMTLNYFHFLQIVGGCRWSKCSLSKNLYILQFSIAFLEAIGRRISHEWWCWS